MLVPLLRKYIKIRASLVLDSFKALSDRVINIQFGEGKDMSRARRENCWFAFKFNCVIMEILFRNTSILKKRRRITTKQSYFNY